MNLAPHITVACVIEKSGKFLIVEEKVSGKRVYNQPAGHVEAGETLIAAAIRETREETGWTVKPTALLGLYVYTSPHNQATYYRTCFVAEALEHNPTQDLDDGIIQALWLSPEELQAQATKWRSPIVYQSIADYLNGKRFSLDCIYEHSTQHS